MRLPFPGVHLTCLLIAMTMALPSLAASAELHVDCSKQVGRIRSLHGSNGGPIQYGELVDLSTYHRELGLPYTRLHDCHWPNPDVVDIHAIFPNSKADPSLPECYDFARTDDYIQAVVDVGSQIVYRLGESIEHTKRKYHVHPPADYERWAAVCLGIIRHYNEGWANGFRHNIRYWEIWNEPENRPAMWTGSDEDYFRLYETASRLIKAHYPDLKIGGPSLGYTGRIVDGRFEPSPFLLQFLERCRQRSLPLDFLSWHLYTDNPSECVIRAEGIRSVLNRYGFEKTESHFNEWNYLPGNDWTPMMLRGQGLMRERFYEQVGGAPGAAFSACVLMFLQDSPVDVANYYMADIQGFGLFSYHGTPKKTFHAFKAFKMLLDTPVRVEASGSQAGRLAICAGVDSQHSEVGILISNYSATDARQQITVSGLPWDGPSLCQVFLLDASRNLVKAKELRLPPGMLTITEDLKAPSVCLVKLRKA